MASPPGLRVSMTSHGLYRHGLPIDVLSHNEAICLHANIRCALSPFVLPQLADRGMDYGVLRI